MSDINERKIERYIDELYEIYKSSNTAREKFTADGERLIRELERGIKDYLGDLRFYIKFYGIAFVTVVAIFCGAMLYLLFDYRTKIDKTIPTRELVSSLKELYSLQSKQIDIIDGMRIVLKDRIDQCSKDNSGVKK